MPRTTLAKDPEDRLLPGAKYDYLVPRQLLWDACRAFDDCVCPATGCTADHMSLEKLRVLAGGPPMVKKVGQRLHGQAYRNEGWQCSKNHAFTDVLLRGEGLYCGECGSKLIQESVS